MITFSIITLLIANYINFKNYLGGEKQIINMERKNIILGKFLMKDKEFYLSNKYNLFGRNELFLLEKDVISKFIIFI